MPAFLARKVVKYQIMYAVYLQNFPRRLLPGTSLELIHTTPNLGCGGFIFLDIKHQTLREYEGLPDELLGQGPQLFRRA